MAQKIQKSINTSDQNVHKKVKKDLKNYQVKKQDDNNQKSTKNHQNKKGQKIEEKQQDKQQDKQVQNKAIRNVDEFKKYFSQLISKGGDKKKLINKIVQNYSTFFNKFGLKKQPSKVIQLCIKLSDKDVSERIIEIIMKNDIQDLIKSKYGRFLMMRIIKYSNKEQKNKIFKILFDNLYQFVSHQDAILVLDNYMRKAATPHQLTMIKNKLKQLGDSDDNKKGQETEQIENMAIKIIEKELYYNPMSQYIINQSYGVLVKQEQDKVIEALKDKIFELCESKESVALITTLINTNDNKFKKNVIKQTKGKVLEFIEDDKMFKSLIIMKLLLSVDDTKLLNKTIIKELSQSITQVLQNQNGQKIIHNVFNQQYDCLKQYETSKNVFSKKDDQIRNQEIMTELIKPVSEYLIQQFSQEFLTNNYMSRVLQSVISYIVENQYEQYYELIDKTIELFVNEIKEDKKELADHPDAHRVIKLIALLTKNNSDLNDNFNDLIKVLKQKNLNKLLQTRFIYVIIAMIENSSHNTQLIKSVKPIINKISDKSKQGYIILNKLL